MVGLREGRVDDGLLPRRRVGAEVEGAGDRPSRGLEVLRAHGVEAPEAVGVHDRDERRHVVGARGVPRVLEALGHEVRVALGDRPPDDGVVRVERVLQQHARAEADRGDLRDEAGEVVGDGDGHPVVLLAGEPRLAARDLRAVREARGPLDAEEVVVPLGEPREVVAHAGLEDDLRERASRGVPVLLLALERLEHHLVGDVGRQARDRPLRVVLVLPEPEEGAEELACQQRRQHHGQGGRGGAGERRGDRRQRCDEPVAHAAPRPLGDWRRCGRRRLCGVGLSDGGRHVGPPLALPRRRPPARRAREPPRAGRNRGDAWVTARGGPASVQTLGGLAAALGVDAPARLARPRWRGWRVCIGAIGESALARLAGLRWPLRASRRVTSRDGRLSRVLRLGGAVREPVVHAPLEPALGDGDRVVGGVVVAVPVPVAAQRPVGSLRRPAATVLEAHGLGRCRRGAGGGPAPPGGGEGALVRSVRDAGADGVGPAHAGDRGRAAAAPGGDVRASRHAKCLPGGAMGSGTRDARPRGAPAARLASATSSGLVLKRS